MVATGHLPRFAYLPGWQKVFYSLLMRVTLLAVIVFIVMVLDQAIGQPWLYPARLNCCVTLHPVSLPAPGAALRDMLR